MDIPTLIAQYGLIAVFAGSLPEGESALLPALTRQQCADFARQAMGIKARVATRVGQDARAKPSIYSG
jgi:hypothetical protein